MTIGPIEPGANESPFIPIPVRSRRQAMDWSLVLASQGIEAVIDQAPGDGQWALLVRMAEHEPAVNALRLYVRENRGWPWRQELPSGALMDWSSLGWALLAVFFFWAGTEDFVQRGMMSHKAVAAGEWWRLFTAVWLHADLGHLSLNLAVGVLLLGLAMGRLGAATGLLLAYLAGAAGNVAGWYLHGPDHLGLGASGMVMGALGLLTVESLQSLGKTHQPVRTVLGGMLGGVMLFALLGVAPGTDIVAHLGGFLSGAILGALVSPFPAGWLRRRWVSVVSALAFAALVIVPWWLALRHH